MKVVISFEDFPDVWSIIEDPKYKGKISDEIVYNEGVGLLTIEVDESIVDEVMERIEEQGYETEKLYFI